MHSPASLFKATVPTLVAVAIGLALPVRACLWDSDTLKEERKTSPDLATAILGGTVEPVDSASLRERIRTLKAFPREDDPAWWNELAGAYVRLGETTNAVQLLEHVKVRFPDDYGIHANLGTVYHLQGRYVEAEKEIARDLEINPDAHFGLEKYHLALLQYLIRDKKYQSRHVYVDEYSAALLQSSGPMLIPSGFDPDTVETNSAGRLRELEESYQSMAKTDGDALGQVLAEMSLLDERPAYRKKWDLSQDPKFLEGIIYMATLNPKQPACFVMLGVEGWRRRDLNLAVAAFEKAIALGSPQESILKLKVESIREHIRKAQGQKRSMSTGLVLVGLILIGGLVCVMIIIRRISASLSRG